ncbi:hypothetical protein [Sporosarcina sp. FA9]|uniref:hypothetical protein n=1 Tax=Sporosarcina sp. FA9 TaxID=3413030 RepID=UPI003F65DC32
MNEEDNGDDLGLETKVDLIQETALITSGTGTINQTQSAEASGEINSNGKQPAFSLKVLVKNGLEIIKRGADTFIKVIQRIDINEDTIEIVENEFLLEHNLTGQVQEYSNIYDWGTLYIINKAIASIMNDDITAFMESIISFDFVLGKPKNEDNDKEEVDEEDDDNGNNNGEDNGEDNGNGNEEGNGNNNGENNGNGNEEGNGNNNGENNGNEDANANNNEEDNANNNVDKNEYSYEKNNAYNNKTNYINYIKNKKDSIVWELDSDNDGIADFLEIFKFNTNPFNPDTDGDGLTDLYEVTYLDANKKHSLQVTRLTKQERFKYLFQMDYSPKDLNPLMKDTNQNGINDGEEDFDQDGIINACDLNPYDGLSNYLSDWLNNASGQAPFFRTQQKFCASQK